MFSSLNKIEDAEYTFNTIFQAEEYKVIQDFFLTQSCYACASVVRLQKVKTLSILFRVFHAYLQIFFYTQVYVVLRPYVNEFLQAMMKHFEVNWPN